MQEINKDFKTTSIEGQITVSSDRQSNQGNSLHV